MFRSVARIAEVSAAAVVASAVTVAMTAGRHPAAADDMAAVANVVRTESAASQQPQNVNATYWLAVSGITGTGTNRLHRDEIPVESWSFEAHVPVDSGSGQPSGRTSYGPLMITANSSTATPQLLNDLATNSNLATVTLTEFRAGTETGGTGAVGQFLKLVLSNVRITKFSAGGTDGSAFDTYEFTYRKLQLTVGSKTVNVDTIANPG